MRIMMWFPTSPSIGSSITTNHPLVLSSSAEKHKKRVVSQNITWEVPPCAINAQQKSRKEGSDIKRELMALVCRVATCCGCLGAGDNSLFGILNGVHTP